MQAIEAFNQIVHAELGHCAENVVRASVYLQENNVVEARKKYYTELFLRMTTEVNQQPQEQRALFTKFLAGVKKKVGLQ